MIPAFEVRTGAQLFTVETSHPSIGGMAFSLESQILHFVDETTNTLNSITPMAACASAGPRRLNPGYGLMVEKAKASLGSSFGLYKNYSCLVDPQIPDTIYFDQVHDDTCYASDNPNVQSNMTGMDAEAALLADRFDFEYTVRVVTWADGTPMFQWDGYLCENDFIVMKDAAADEVQLMYTDKELVDLDALVLRSGVTYRFTLRDDATACVHDSPNVGSDPIPTTGNDSGCAARGPLMVTVSGTAVSRTNERFYLHTDDGQVLSLAVEQI